jgi:hypothetical protein
MMVLTTLSVLICKLYSAATIVGTGDTYRRVSYSNCILGSVMEILSWQPCVFLYALNRQLGAILRNLSISVKFERGESN